MACWKRADLLATKFSTFDLYVYALHRMDAYDRSGGSETSVNYGKITAVKPVTVENPQAQGAGALVGGTIGLISGRHRSGSNQALRGVAGGVAGQQIAKHASSKQTFEYTILVGGKTTTTVVTDEAGMRIGDCVALEQGAYVNLRWWTTASARRGPKLLLTQHAMRLPAAWLKGRSVEVER